MASPQTTDTPEADDNVTGAENNAAVVDASPLWMVALRDVAVVAAALSLFAAADAWHVLVGGTLSATLSLVDGLLVGILLTALLHEWGHFIGARISGAAAPLRPATGFLPLFDFHYGDNSSSQFQSMSVGGNVAHWLVVLVLLSSLSLSTVGQVAIASSSFGFPVFASSIEFPVIRNVMRGQSGIEALSKIPKDLLRRNGSYGLVAAFFAFWVL